MINYQASNKTDSIVIILCPFWLIHLNIWWILYFLLYDLMHKLLSYSFKHVAIWVWDTVLGKLELPNDWISNELLNLLLLTLTLFLKMCPLLPHPLTWKKNGAAMSHRGKAGKKQTFHELATLFKIEIAFPHFCKANWNQLHNFAAHLPKRGWLFPSWLFLTFCYLSA